MWGETPKTTKGECDVRGSKGKDRVGKIETGANPGKMPVDGLQQAKSKEKGDFV
jgi:hypothetical protein